MTDAKRFERDKEMLLNPEDWPMWPYLPLKRRPLVNDGSFPNFGWVTADFPTIVLQEKPTAKGVLLQMALELPPDELAELGAFDPSGKFPDEVKVFYTENIIKRYSDVEGLLDDGWTVD